MDARRFERRKFDRMMIVPNYIGPSEIEGVGIFAAAPIKKGESIWILEERFDLLLPVAELENLPVLQRDFLDRYGYPHMTRQGLIVLEFDNGRFMNHSEHPNTDFTRPDIAWAVRDIDEDEEITCDYAQFDPSFAMQPGRYFASVCPAHPSDDIGRVGSF